MTNATRGTTATRLIRILLDLAGPGSELIGAREREWASATFSGARHSIDLRLSISALGDAPPAAMIMLPEHQFALSGEIVADCVVAFGMQETDSANRVWQNCQIELLTIASD